ncbi:MAG: TetR/AcrR family transcriptional regulator [Desulfovibrio sp.]|uniref:TetR/AcrR family transcriptional regulator n=1 Tax=Desulfovibrio sp. 7SRBS1 TaxID=3378064 RepID=UPI003B3ED4BA
MARRQQEKSRQTGDELLAAATELFGTKGFAATSVNDITERAGYAKGSFYRHFKSKDELFLRIVADKLADYRMRRDRQITAARSLDDVYAIIWDFLESIVQDKGWSASFLEFTIHASRNPDLCAELNNGVYRLSNDIFAGMVRPFLPEGYPPEKLGAFNTALFEGFLIHNLLGTGTLDTADIRQAALNLAKSFIAAPKEHS